MTSKDGFRDVQPLSTASQLKSVQLALMAWAPRTFTFDSVLFIDWAVLSRQCLAVLFEYPYITFMVSWYTIKRVSSHTILQNGATNLRQVRLINPQETTYVSSDMN